MIRRIMPCSPLAALTSTEATWASSSSSDSFFEHPGASSNKHPSKITSQYDKRLQFMATPFPMLFPDPPEPPDNPEEHPNIPNALAGHSAANRSQTEFRSCLHDNYPRTLLRVRRRQ